MLRYIILLGAALLVLTGCSAQATEEESIRTLLEAANHCEVDSDCAVVTSVCPFDCYALTHRSQSGVIAAMLQDYQNRSTCTNSCVPVPHVACQAQRCVFAR